MMTWLVRCRICGVVFRLARGELHLPQHCNQRYPDLRCSGSGTPGAPHPQPPGATTC
jgi:hypothetical protein